MADQGGELAGQISLVTGAGSGIGLGIAGVLARHGSVVVCLDIKAAAAEDAAKQIEASGARAFSRQHDVRDWEGAKVLANEVEESIGPIGILVNNAGVYHAASLENLSQEAHERLYAVNVGGVFGMCRAVIPGMKRRREGKIVNISSVAGRDPLALSPSYGSSKSAVLGLTKSLAKDLAGYNINVNAVLPGFVWSELTQQSCVEMAAITGKTAEEVWQSRVAAVPLKRAQDPEDIGEAVAFLASARARNITGQGLSVCGGAQMHG
ncbi:putative sorbitol-6-phosphate dehydrogenase [Mesorhizobium plurifarium]|uniref:Putative sorbitol-6-phosphate dehydrogenase n=1 Tax=Mesorhizobium plurifarium TaxID=69974 RepID=A0A090GKH8_MESPL|nr:putative sorbitol-6-phosphate dehydrogenase [Mesorhizobium plurifarium]